MIWGISYVYLGLLSFLLLAGGSGLVYFSGRRTITDAQRADAARERKEMEELLAHPGWKRLAKIADAQTLERRNKVLLAPTTEPLAQEYMKGEIHGISLFMEIPKVISAQAEDILARYSRETEGS